MPEGLHEDPELAWAVLKDEFKDLPWWRTFRVPDYMPNAYATFMGLIPGANLVVQNKAMADKAVRDKISVYDVLAHELGHVREREKRGYFPYLREMLKPENDPERIQYSRSRPIEAAGYAEEDKRREARRDIPLPSRKR